MPLEDPQSVALVLKALRGAWHALNHTLFADAMRPPVFTLLPGDSLLGCWRRELRELGIQRALLLREPWGRVQEVLKHEMAHQYVDEVLKVQGEGPHGPAFRSVCAQRGIDAEPSGLPEPVRQDRTMDRVMKLLALAESEDRHEAEAAASRAQALMLKHNLRPQTAAHSYGFRQLGAPKGRIYEHSRWLAHILTQHFFVEGLWVPAFDVGRGVQGQVLEVSGRPENLEIASYVWSFLTDTAERLWSRHKVDQRIRSNRGRRRFLAGVMRGFLERLDTDKLQHEARGLVWVGDADLSRWQARRHPHTRTIRRNGEQRDHSYFAGHHAGGQIVLQRGVQAQDNAQGRLLGAGRGA